MKQTQEIGNHPEETTLFRLLGEPAAVLNCKPVFINRLVRAEYLQVSVSENNMPEEAGRLFLYPIEDGRFNLHLLYRLKEDLEHTEVCWIQFMPEFFLIFEEEMLLRNTPFRFDRTTELQFNMCSQVKLLLEEMKNISGLTKLLQSLQLTEISVQVLRRALEQISFPFTACPVPACRFLANDSEREKIFEARRFLEQHPEQMFTIRELSRKVAMNECYLKKGFKTLTGKTINEYQQELRINKAKLLLQQEGQTVSEVAMQLGYSSISHFSTAFKKATGLKPCELLG